MFPPGGGPAPWGTFGGLSTAPSSSPPALRRRSSRRYSTAIWRNSSFLVSTSPELRVQAAPCVLHGAVRDVHCQDFLDIGVPK
jgi:hypothetical protein